MPKHAFNNDAGYNGNSALPRADAEIALTQHELAEYVRCTNDVYYFINNYVKIVHVDRGIVPFRMWPFQEEIVQAFEDNRFVICKLARQSGKSTVVVCGYFLWYILFHPDVSVGILANKEATAIELLRRLKQSYELLPMFMKQGILKWDQKLIMLANNSRVRAESTSASAIRGDTFNILFLDEFAFVPENIAVDFMTSVFPTISSGKTTKLFIVSTPKGYNLFYKIWNDAEEKRNSYYPIGFTWRDVPGRDDAWAEEMRKNLGSDLSWEQEFECSFEGSANTLVSSKKLAQMIYRPPIEERNGLKVYAHPVRADEYNPSHVYIATVDVSQGQELDYSVMSVFDVSVSPWRQVAVFRRNNLSPQLFAPIVRDIALHYCSAFILTEINDVGAVVADMLNMELEYGNIIYIRNHPKRGQTLAGPGHKKSRPGLRTSAVNKRIGCSALRAMLEKDQLLVFDFETIRELTTFVAHGQNWRAETGAHDDCVMTLVLLGWLSTQQGFENYVGLSMRKLLANQYEPVTLDSPPHGFFDVNAGTGPSKIIEDNTIWDVDDASWL
jgi:hypothetical protein